MNEWVLVAYGLPAAVGSLVFLSVMAKRVAMIDDTVLLRREEIANRKKNAAKQGPSY